MNEMKWHEMKWNEWMQERTNEERNEWMDGWMHGWTDGWVDIGRSEVWAFFKLFYTIHDYVNLTLLRLGPLYSLLVELWALKGCCRKNQTTTKTKIKSWNLNQSQSLAIKLTRAKTKAVRMSILRWSATRYLQRTRRSSLGMSRKDSKSKGTSEWHAVANRVALRCFFLVCF